MTTEYSFIPTVPSADDFCHLRQISGMSPRPLEAVIKALPASCYGMHIVCEGKSVGMGRIIGDGIMTFQIVDIAVDPAHQGKGLGRKIMESIMAWLDRNAAKGAYISLIADVPELYAKFGFVNVRPASEGMAIVWK